MVKLKIIPTHLQPFWRFYERLMSEGLFDRLYQTLDDDELKAIPLSIRTYGKNLVRALLEEEDAFKKLKLYHALEVLLEYIAETLATGAGGRKNDTK